MSRPVVSVFNINQADSVSGTVTLPAVFTAPIRSDVVHYVHTLMAKNKRQPYAVDHEAAMQVIICFELIKIGEIIVDDLFFLIFRLLLNLGVLVALFLVFLVFLVVVLPDLVKVRSETCAEVVACSVKPRFGDAGTRRSV
jgi:hypothetical protein